MPGSSGWRRSVTMAEYYTAAELEALTGIPEATWRYWSHTGKGPASFKLGRRRMWRRAVVDEWLAEQENPR
jgi:prophage regulatory protein